MFDYIILDEMDQLESEGQLLPEDTDVKYTNFATVLSEYMKKFDSEEVLMAFELGLE